MICKINVKSFFSADFQALILVRNKLRILGRRLYHIESFPEEQNENSLELRTKNFRKMKSLQRERNLSLW